MAALERRHLADLRLPEVTRALRALSSTYVQRRHLLAQGGALESAGKRAAFALFYGPIHYATTWHIIQSLPAADAPATVNDLGCGTGAAGAAWAMASGGRAAVSGVDRHPWAAAEAKWTYRHFGLRGQARAADVARLPSLSPGSGVVAAYLLNELADASRERVQQALLSAASRGTRVLILEPVARRVAPWWGQTAQAVVERGGREDEWRFPSRLPPLVRLLDEAAGLDHREISVRSLALNFGSARPR